MADYRIPYAEYVRGGRWNESSEGGQGNQPMSEEQWNALSLEQQFMNHQGDFIEADEADAAAFRERFGAAAWKPTDSGRPEDNRLIYSWSSPVEGNTHEWGDAAIDPSRVMQLPDGRWVTEASNIKGDYLAAQQARNDHSDMWALAPLAIVALAYGLPPGLFEGAEVAAGGNLANLSAGEILSGTTGIAEGEAVGSALASASNTSLIPSITAPEIGSLGATPTGGLAPVVNSVPAVPGTSPGIVDGAMRGARTVGSWYNGLSPASRFILGQAVSHGANALAGASAQREAQEAADEREEQEREDRVRRGSVPDFSGAFKPKTNTPKPGIIDGLRIPRPGG